MKPYCETKGWRTRYVCRFIGHIPFPGDHRACGSRLVKVSAFVLMRVEGWNRKKKGVKRPSISTEGQITEEAAPPKRPWKRVCSSLASDVPDGLTNINGSEITAQYSPLSARTTLGDGQPTRVGVIRFDVYRLRLEIKIAL